jgi:hypothetical protein
MGRPQLTFFCELPSHRLSSIVRHPELEVLSSMEASISLAILDFSQERAEFVRSLNHMGIPVTAWLLVPRDQGYWLGMENAEVAKEIYTSFKSWTTQENLTWRTIGLDIEPDIREFEAWIDGDRRRWAFQRMLSRLFQRRKLAISQRVYRQLAGAIRSDGYLVESYNLPLIADERLVGSTLLRRILGIVDFPVDTDVWMLYSSNLRGNPEHPHFGLGMLWSYGAQAQAIGVGSTGGGIDFIQEQRYLDWDELSRDLRLAWYWTNRIYIFSLEGCIEQGFLTNLEHFQWDQPIFFPESSAERVAGWRGFLQSILWISAHLLLILTGIASMVLFFVGLRRWIKKRGAD